MACLSAHRAKHPECLVGVGEPSQALIPAGLKQHSVLSASVAVAVAVCHSPRRCRSISRCPLRSHRSHPHGGAGPAPGWR